MIDDRPIKPDKKYLEEYIERISKVQKKDFLRKKQEAVLPCFAHKQSKLGQPDLQRQESRSKAQVYEQIKRKNRQKFGDKKLIEVQSPQPKKIDPKNCTIDYKPKHPVSIDTEQYKKKADSQCKSRKAVEKDQQPKIQYEKLLDYYRKELHELEKEKEEFNKVATKLKFKENISKEEGLLYSRIKSQAEKNLITQSLSVKSCGLPDSFEGKPVSKDKGANLKTVKQCSKQKLKQVYNYSKTFSIGQIRNCMNEVNERLLQTKDKLLNGELKIQQRRYDISQIYLLPQFDPQTIFDFIDHKKLIYNGNDYYRQAIQAFNTKLSKENQARINQNQEDMNVQQVEHDHKSSKGIKVKYIGEKRVMKYEGWAEVWIPGKQRLMANKDGYKVVWLSNGDVLQQFSNQITTYYSKAKGILKIDYKNLRPIYYHSGMHQLWRLLQNNQREIIFANRRREIIQTKDDI